MLTMDCDIIKDDLLKNISERFNIDYDLLLEELNKIKITKHTKSKYSCDNNFFSRDNELSFYWAGFLAADGCLFKKINTKTINLYISDKDEGHLRLFKNHVNYNGIIRRSMTRRDNPNWKDTTQCGMVISSAEMFNDLGRFNLKPNKSLIYEFPEHLKNHEYIHHFIRGYIDGDGCFYFDASRNRVCFELRGTNNCMQNILDIFGEQCGIKHESNVTKPDATSKIKLSGKKYMFKLVDYLYKDATIFLQRKYDIAKLCYDIGKRKNKVHK